MVKWIIIASLVGVGGYFIWWLSLPVEIIGVHDKSNILVKAFPFTRQGRVSWWNKNKAMLKEKYQIPHEYYDGSYTVVIWDIGDGYKVMPEANHGPELVCFDDIKTPADCIEKKPLLTIMKGNNGSINFY